jgi:hypothetical protein
MVITGKEKKHPLATLAHFFSQKSFFSSSHTSLHFFFKFWWQSIKKILAIIQKKVVRYILYVGAFFN